MGQRFIDIEGDVWQEESDSALVLVEENGKPSTPTERLSRRTVETAYGPLAPVATIEGDNLVDFVRELRELCDRWAIKLGV